MRLKKRYFLLAALLAIVSVSLTSCVTSDPYRTDYSLCDYKTDADCHHNNLQHYGAGAEDEYYLGFIEYDDQGQLHDREQMNAVLNTYRELAATSPVIIVTFVHGWHHNASPDDDNIRKFRTMLTRLSAKEHTSSAEEGRGERVILGLYVGWRGEAVSIPVLNALTFWDRKNAAHSVGQQGVTEALLKLEEIVNVKAGIESAEPPRKSHMVVVGHSFGGAVVFSSLQKILADRFIDSRKGKTWSGQASGFGDLVMLLNPAFEALRYSTLYDLSQEYCRSYFPGQLPRLAVLTSEADYATGIAFPVGRFLSTQFDNYRPMERHECATPGSAGKRPMTVEEVSAARYTVGHFEPYLTHELLPVTTAPLQAKSQSVSALQTEWLQQTREYQLQFTGSQLVHLGRTVPLNPYLNVKVDKALIGGHNDIWGDEIINFMRDMILISTTPNLQSDPY